MKPLNGRIGWALLAAFVCAWDMHPSTETLSHAYANSSAKYKHGHPVSLVVWGVLTVHLMRLLPDRLDPIRRLAAHWPYKEH